MNIFANFRKKNWNGCYRVFSAMEETKKSRSWKSRVRLPLSLQISGVAIYKTYMRIVHLWITKSSFSNGLVLFLPVRGCNSLWSKAFYETLSTQGVYRSLFLKIQSTRYTKGTTGGQGSFNLSFITCTGYQAICIFL